MIIEWLKYFHQIFYNDVYKINKSKHERKFERQDEVEVDLAIKIWGTQLLILALISSYVLLLFFVIC